MNHQRSPNRTYLRVTLIHVTDRTNITLSLPSEELKRVRILAAQRGTSVSRLLADTLRDLVEREEGYSAARRRNQRRLRQGFVLGTRGDSSWARDDLHAR